MKTDERMQVFRKYEKLMACESSKRGRRRILEEDEKRGKKKEDRGIVYVCEVNGRK